MTRGNASRRRKRRLPTAQIGLVALVCSSSPRAWPSFFPDAAAGSTTSPQMHQLAASATTRMPTSTGMYVVGSARGNSGSGIRLVEGFTQTVSVPPSRRRHHGNDYMHMYDMYVSEAASQSSWRKPLRDVSLACAADSPNGLPKVNGVAVHQPPLQRPNVITPLPPTWNGVDANTSTNTSTSTSTSNALPTQTTLQRLSSNLRSAVSVLLAKPNADASDRDSAVVPNHLIEEWSVLIYDSMSAPSRSFHCLDHLWDITGDESPATSASTGNVDDDAIDAIQTLAAYFHDVVYYQIDGGLSPAQSAKLSGIITIDPIDATLSLSPDIAYYAFMDPYLAMVCDLFGFDISADTKLDPFRGMNEFLSAIVAVRCLQSTLSFQHIVAIVACIEATVPFRPNDANGISPSEALFNRLTVVRNKYQKQMSGTSASDTDGDQLTDADLVIMVQRAVGLANRDVGNFAACPSRFLANTWALLPESNISFRHTAGTSPTYRISDYASAMTRMAGFFSYLDPSVVFSQFREYPTNPIYYDMVGRVGENLKVAKTYMKAKVLSAAVLAALAELSGGDCPMTLLVGDMPVEDKNAGTGDLTAARIEDYITVDFDANGLLAVDETVFTILRDGRDCHEAFDIPNSPIATYIYGMVGDEGLNRLISYAVTPMDATSAKTLLGVMPNRVVNEIATAASNVATTRSRELRNIAREYEESDL